MRTYREGRERYLIDHFTLYFYRGKVELLIMKRLLNSYHITHRHSLVHSAALSFVATLTLSLFLTCVSSLSTLGQEAQAQSLNINLDSSVSSGLMVGPSGREISVSRSPLLLDFDAAFIFDGDESVEWVLGTLIQAEYTPAFAINPQVRLRRRWSIFEGFAGVGIPFFFKPYTRFGSELSLGFSFPAEGAIAFIGHANLQTYFLGSDLPDSNTVFTMNGAVGVRMRF